MPSNGVNEILYFKDDVLALDELQNDRTVNLDYVPEEYVYVGTLATDTYFMLQKMCKVREITDIDEFKLRMSEYII